MILLSDHAIKQKEGGQSLIGGLDVEVCRNYFGSQVSSSIAIYVITVFISFEKIHSCAVTIPVKDASILPSSDDNQSAFNAVFIRAPAILKVNFTPFSVT